MQDLFKITFLPIGQRQLAGRCGSKTRLLPVFFAFLLLAKKKKRNSKSKVTIITRRLWWRGDISLELGSMNVSHKNRMSSSRGITHVLKNINRSAARAEGRSVERRMMIDEMACVAGTCVLWSAKVCDFSPWILLPKKAASSAPLMC